MCLNRLMNPYREMQLIEKNTHTIYWLKSVTKRIFFLRKPRTKKEAKKKNKIEMVTHA